MSVLINFKICDNSKDCNGIKVCPVGAIFWDEKRKTVAVNNKKCISCGMCEKSCLIGAIRVAKNEKEYKKIEEEIKKDPRKTSDLFIDRYGAQPIVLAFLCTKEDFNIRVLEATKMVVVELFNNDSMECLLHSIPIKELVSDYNVSYKRMEIQDNDFLKKYKIKTLPSLLFFKNGILVGKIEGYYDIKRKKELKEKVDKVLA
ncbi:MAG: thioredoxin domain-containing protein [Patescibacteria group bacterium]